MALPNFRERLSEAAFGSGGVRLNPAVAPRGLAAVGFLPIAPTGKDATPSSELVNAIRAFKPDVDKFFESEMKDQRAAEYERGQLEAGRNQLQYAQAIEQGIIKEGQSPWFIKGHIEQDGRAKGLEYQVALKTAWADSPLRTSTDPKDFSEFVGKFRREYIQKANFGERGTDWWRGFAHTADRADGSLASEHSDNLQREISTQVRSNTGAEIKGILDRLGRDPANAAGEITALRDKMRASGLALSETDKIIGEQVIAHAKATRNPAVLAVLDSVMLSNGKPLSSDARIVAAKAELEAHLQDRARSDTRWAWAVDDRQWSLQQRERAKVEQQRADERWQREKDTWTRQDYARNTTSLALLKILSDPANYQENIRPLLRDLSERGYGEEASQLSRVGQAFLDDRQKIDDRAARGRYTNDIIDAAGDSQRQLSIIRRLNQDLIDGRINKDSFGALVEDARRFGEMNPLRFLQNPAIADVFTTVDKIALKDRAQVLTGQAAATALDVKVQLKRLAIELKEKTPGMSDMDLAVALNKKLTELTPLLNPDVPGSALSEVQRQAREVQAGRPEPSLQEIARSLPAEIKARLVKAVTEATDEVTAMKALSDFDARAKRPGLAQEIISQENKRMRDSQRKPPQGTPRSR